MGYQYKYETFRADSGDFNKNFTSYLNERARDKWRVKDCSYCHGSDGNRVYASCMFERKS